MSDSINGIRHQMTIAKELKSVVSIMKTIAASNLKQYECSVDSLSDYYRTVQLGLAACFQQKKLSSLIHNSHYEKVNIGVIVFGSDQGLVGQFNEAMVDYLVEMLSKLPGQKTIWAVGERLQSRLVDAELVRNEGFILPSSISTIPAIVSDIIMELENKRVERAINDVYVLHHRPAMNSIYTPIFQQLLPLDETWRNNIASIVWPTNNKPEVMPDAEQTLRAFVREFLFVCLFKACAESLASENASRLASMQRSEKNIKELQQELKRKFQSLRQSKMDAELFDVLAGFKR